jgi:hypothetical protein
MQNLSSQFVTISSIGVLISALAAAVAAIFVARQVFYMKKSREVDTFLRLIEAGNDEKVKSAADWIKYEMPRQLSYEDAKKDPALWTRLTTVFHHFEMIGILVLRHHVSRDLVYDQMGPWILGTWGKVEHLVVANRGAKRAPDYCENFELLVLGHSEWAKRNPAKLEKRARAIHRDYYS